jgi:hypothetical protein
VPAPATIGIGGTACDTENTGDGPARIKAHGVTCRTARSVVHDFATKGVFWHFVGTNHGNGYSPVDGWRCTLFQGYTDCTRHGKWISGTPLPPKASCNRSVEYRPGLFAYIAEYVGMTCTEARNFAIARANHPSPPPSGFVCHDLHAEAGGGAEECVSGSRRIKIDNA